MLTGRHFLFVPGPTNVPDRVLRAMHVPMEDHRSVFFPKLAEPLFAQLKRLYKTEAGRVFMYPGSGTAAWEAAISNTLSPGDRVLCPRFGQFSHLWADMAERLGLDVAAPELEWGDGIDEVWLEQQLRADAAHAIKAVLVCHNETATGVVNDLPAIRKAMDAAGHPAMLFVDAVSSLGSIDLCFDQWRIDACITGSQKGLMMPAGLGFLALSPRALAASKSSTMRRCYFDINDMMRNNDTGYFPYTPPLPMLYGLRDALAMIEEEGHDNVIARHYRLAEGVRAAVTDGWGMRPAANQPRWYSNTVTAVQIPRGIDGSMIVKRAATEYNLALGAGLSKFAGKVFRIGHLGDLNDLMLCAAISGAEMAMRDVGIAVEPGSGVAAAVHRWEALKGLIANPGADKRGRRIAAVA